jgi:hypothetical protein
MSAPTPSPSAGAIRLSRYATSSIGFSFWRSPVPLRRCGRSRSRTESSRLSRSRSPVLASAEGFVWDGMQDGLVAKMLAGLRVLEGVTP